MIIIRTLVTPRRTFCDRILFRCFCDLQAISLPKKFDFTRSTEENYAQGTQIPPSFVGQFGSIRSLLDYSYHSYYVPERQIFHDFLVRDFLASSASSTSTEEPQWLVFTAGAMGAGKSRCVRWLQTHRIFPRQNVVKVDPDVIRYRFPETAGYLQRDPSTMGTLTHKEAGYVQEVLAMAALRLGRTVLVDGSLRDERYRMEHVRFNSLLYPKFQSQKSFVEYPKDLIEPTYFTNSSVHHEAKSL